MSRSGAFLAVTKGERRLREGNFLYWCRKEIFLLLHSPQKKGCWGGGGFLIALWWGIRTLGRNSFDEVFQTIMWYLPAFNQEGS